MPRVQSDIDRGESLPVPLQPVPQKYLSLEGYTVMPRATPGDSWKQGEISLEGYTPAKMAAGAATTFVANGLKAQRAHSPGQVSVANDTPGHV